jgi:site-specific recombinase XerD
VGAIKCAKKIRLPYSAEDIERLKETCGTIRDKAIISFLLSTGCRVSEVCALNREDIDINSLECKVLGKGNKERTVYFDKVTAMLLNRYILTRDDISPALFIGKGSKRLTAQGMRYMLKKVSEKANVENVHPHRFRRTLATNLIDRGMPIQEVVAVLGHDRIDTTTDYIYIEKENVKSAYRKYA